MYRMLLIDYSQLSTQLTAGVLNQTARASIKLNNQVVSQSNA